MSPGKYTIQLQETITDTSQLAQIARDAAQLLGTNADQMEALLARGVGARIARAGKRKRAEQVANLLRQVGIQVEVIEPVDALVGVGASEAAPSPKPEPAWAPAPSEDPFSAPEATHDPFAATAESLSRSTSEEMQRFDELFSAPVETKQTTFDPPVDDAFAPTPSGFDGSTNFAEPTSGGQYDPFATGENDPFASPTGDFRSTHNTSEDPFAAPAQMDSSTTDPFASQDDPFSPARKPGTATILREDPFAAPINLDASDDPFAAPSTNALSPAALDAETVQTRPSGAPRRSSLRRQMLLAVFAPVLLVALSVVAFLFYSVPRTVTEGLQKKGLALAELAAQGVYEDLASAPQSEAVDNLTRKSFDFLTGAVDGAFFAYVKNGKVVAFASRTKVEKTDVEQAITANWEGMAANGGMAMTSGNNAGVVPFAMASASVQDLSTGGTLGTVFAGLDTYSIQTELVRTIVPILAAVGLALAIAAAIAFGLTNRFMRPITAATEQANRISLGDLDQSVPVDRNDEIGDLLEGLERMRVSLKSMVARMRRNR